MNTTKLMEMYNSTFQPALAEGVYEVKMLKHEYVANEKAPYIKFTFEVLNSKRQLTENRFEKGFGVMVSHLRQQLGRENEAIKPQEFFDELITKQTPFKIWVVKRMVNGYPRTNFNFLKPVAETTPNTTVVDDSVVTPTPTPTPTPEESTPNTNEESTPNTNIVED